LKAVVKTLLGALVAIVGLAGLPVQAQRDAAAGRGNAVPPASARRAATAHLDVVTYATDAEVAPGSAFSLVFEVTPRNGIHVYAPGAGKYKIVKITLEPNSVLVVDPVQYPEPEMYLFAPLKEIVPVFQRPFMLTERITVSGAPEHRAALAKMSRITIKGTLDYQACDDRVCFLPASIPVSYTVKLRRP
jgi:DsbC/DsbD-like thiol-disulfide interchange protein